MPDYRPLSDDEMDDFHSYVQYAFSISEGPWSPDEDEESNDSDDETSELGEEYGFFANDELVSVCKHYHWQTWVRGDRHPLVGLSAVATPPEHRRSGYVRDMLHAALTTYRDDGNYLSVLWPFKHPFYERLGWGTAYHGYEHTCDPDALAEFRGRHGGDWRRLEADDWAAMVPVHDAHGSAYELTIEREEEWWRNRIFQGWKKDPFVYGYERDGELAAYVSFVVSDGDDGDVLRTQDVAWVDHDAREAIYGFLARHDSQVDQVGFWNMDDDLLWQVDDPDEIETKCHAAAMFRLVDVPAALEATTYSPSVDAEFVLEVRDPIADWNDRRFRVSVSDGDASVDRPETDDADASLRIDALSQLYVGARDVEFLTRTDRLDADDQTATTLDALFPESSVLLREGF